MRRQRNPVLILAAACSLTASAARGGPDPDRCHRQTVLENIKLALLRDSLLSFIPDPTIDPKARAIAERVGLTPVLDRLPSTLPFAELRRLGLAKATARHPKVILVDEPTLGLAPVILEQISLAITRLRETTPMTILLGERNVTCALPHADRIYVLEHARVAWEGRADRFAAEAGAAYL